MTFAGLGNLEARFSDKRQHQQWLDQKERNTERAIAGIESQGSIDQTFIDNHKAQYQSLILEDYSCNESVIPDFSIPGSSMPHDYVKVFDKSKRIIGTLYPLNDYPQGRFQFTPVCNNDSTTN